MKQAENCRQSTLLADYLGGHLDLAAQADLKAHIAGCRECGSLLERLRAFEGEGQDGPEWAPVSDRLTARFDQALRQRVGAKRRPVRRIAWHPIVAWSVAALLVYPAWLGMSRGVGTPRPRIQAARVIELDTSRSAIVAKPVQNTEGGPAVLSFFVPVRPDCTYTARVETSKHEVVAGPATVESDDGLGHFTLVLADLPKDRGDLTLMVTEQAPGNAAPRVFPVPFHL